jgi:predicted transcriptional regulator
MKPLTRAEEQIMQIMWRKGDCFVHDILAAFGDAPKPAYNTVSTVVRILEKKGYIGHHSLGKSHKYYALISKKEYARRYLSGMMSGYFSGSYKQLVSFFSKEADLSVQEMEEIRSLIDAQIEKKKQDQE